MPRKKGGAASSRRAQHADYDTEHFRWTKAVSILGGHSSPGILAWSPCNLLAVPTRRGLDIVNVEAALEHVEGPPVIAQVDLPPPDRPYRSDNVTQVVHAIQTLRFVSVEWSPMGCGPDGSSLLAAAFSRGFVKVYSMPLPGMIAHSSYFGGADGVLKAPVFCTIRDDDCRRDDERQNLGAKSRKRSYEAMLGAAGGGSHVGWPYVAFSPSALAPHGTLGHPGSPAALLCVAQGSSVRLWRLRTMPVEHACIAVLSLAPSLRHPNTSITGLCAGSICDLRAEGGGEPTVAVAAGVRGGYIQIWRAAVPASGQEGDGAGVPPVPEPQDVWETVTPEQLVGTNGYLPCGGDVAAPRTAMATEVRCGNLAGGPEETGHPIAHLIVAAHGVALCAVAWGAGCKLSRCLKPESAKDAAPAQVFRFKGSRHSCREHARPIIAVSIESSGALAKSTGEASSLFLDRVRILTIDGGEQAYLWQLSKGSICICRRWALKPASHTEWMTTTEQTSAQMGAHFIRGAAGPGLRGSGSVSFTGVAFSPSGCLLAAQAVGQVTRTTQFKLMTYIEVTPCASPGGTFASFLWTLCKAYQRLKHGGPFGLSAWDVAQSWHVACKRTNGQGGLQPVDCPTQPGSRSGPPPPAPTAPVGSPNDPSVAPSCRQLLAWLWEVVQDAVRESGQKESGQLVRQDAFPRGAPQSFFLEALEGELHAGRPGDPAWVLALCQVRNLIMELASRLTVSRAQALGYVRRHTRRAVHGTTLDDGLENALLRSYWLERANHYWRRLPVGLAPPAPSSGQLLQQHLLMVDRSAGDFAIPCEVCGKSSTLDWSLTQLSCGAHTMPLCQISLKPLFRERFSHCSLCMRHTALVGYTLPESAALPPGICGWCGTFSASTNLSGLVRLPLRASASDAGATTQGRRANS